MDRECKCSLPSKVNKKCTHKDKFRRKCSIYEVKRSLRDAIYIGKTQQKLTKRMDGHFSDVQCLRKNGLKSDSLAAHYGQHL